MLRITSRLAAVILLLLVNASPAWAGKKPSLKIMVLGTVDGSRLTGMVETESVSLSIDGAAKDVSMHEIEAIRFNENHTLADVSLAGGERVSGQIEGKPLQLTTAVGWVSVPWAKVAELCVPEDKPTGEDVTYHPLPVRPVRFELTLRDGSRVFGTPDEKTATVFCPMGRLELPWALIRKVTFHEDRETSTLELWNGDALVACVDWRAFELSTGLGRVQVSTVHTETIELSLGGIDLVAKPYESAEGDRYFMGAVNASRPKWIQGRVRPASEFIEAHAGGRVVYAFDEPVREFHAVLTMYESYRGTKGSVVFKIETDDGLVYTSPLIRNREHKDLYLRFPPTERIVLITDPNGSNQEDWSVWLHPEVR